MNVVSCFVQSFVPGIAKNSAESSTVLRGLVVTALVLGLLGLPGSSPVWAGNGHFLHGVGAVNSSMGGAGTGLPTDVLAALYRNPALLTQLEGHNMAFSIELVTSEPRVSSTVPTPFGPFTGTTEDDGGLAPVPAFGWSRRLEDRPLAIGMGFLGLAGFATDYPQDNGNPVLLPQPLGFGNVFAEYSLLQIPFAVAWQATPKLSLGASLNTGWATLEASPFGATSPDCSSPTDCFFPRLGKDGALGFGLQVGLYYEVSEAWSLGFSYSTPQSFQEFSWNTTVANPALPTFGTGRKVNFTVDVPQITSVGVGFRPSERWSVALDGRWVGYSDTEGFKSGFDPMTGLPRGLGWDDIFVYGLGVERSFDNGVAVRFGYNRSEAAVTESSAFLNVQSPAIFEDHYTVGLGVPLYDKLDLDLGYYHVPNNSVAGPFQTPFGPVPGTQVVNEISVDSAVVTFSFHL